MTAQGRVFNATHTRVDVRKHGNIWWRVFILLCVGSLMVNQIYGTFEAKSDSVFGNFAC